VKLTAGNALSSENLNTYAETMRKAEREWEGAVLVPKKFSTHLTAKQMLHVQPAILLFEETDSKWKVSICG
jgi:hypothetical protein